jgi:diguanylate cyclase (GGDEF)-like protein
MLQNNASSPANIYDESVFKVLVEYEIARSQRYDNILSLLRIGLALLNPTQTETQNAPVALATVLNTRLRRADIPARIGNEFAVLLPSTDETGARAACERLLRMTLGTQNTPLGFSSRITICVGLTTHKGGALPAYDELMREASEALKGARARGPQTYHAYSDTVVRKK